MTNPLESGTYRLFVWEVGGSDMEPTDTGRTGTMAEMMEEGEAFAASDVPLELKGRRIELAGFVVKPEPVQ